jgi:hypothetical protein
MALKDQLVACTADGCCGLFVFVLVAAPAFPVPVLAPPLDPAPLDDADGLLLDDI